MLFVQEGFTHYCERCFDKFTENGGREERAYPDPFHEHVCLDGIVQSFEEQNKNIKLGRELMGDILGVKPKTYDPPNHLWNKDTLKVLEANYFRSVVIRDILGLPAYLEKNLLVIPESKIGERQKSPIKYAYYNQLVDGGWQSFEKELETSRNYCIAPKPIIRAPINSILVKTAKRARDWKNRLS